MSWQLAVIGIVAVLAVFGLVWIFAGRWVSASKDSAVAKDDIGEIAATSKVEEKAEEVGRDAPKTARSLRDWLRGGRV